jgi:hypothetical protein
MHAGWMLVVPSFMMHDDDGVARPLFLDELLVVHITSYYNYY